MATNLIFHKVEHAGQRTLFMLLNVLRHKKLYIGQMQESTE